MFPRQAGSPTDALLHVVTVIRDAGPALDDMVDGVLRQQDVAFAATFLHDARDPEAGDRFPAADARIALMPFGTEIGERQRIEACARTRCAGDDLVVVLPQGMRLADADTLQRVRATFDDPACALAYGQWSTAAGKRGTAEPAPRDDAFRDADATFFHGAPIAFRAHLLQGLLQDATPGKTDGWRDLFDAAGFARTRFCDDVWCVEPAPARAPPASPAVVGTSFPLVSCLMTTYDRLSLAKHAILSFAAQTYPEKELIVVSDGPARFRGSLARYVAALGIARVRFVDAGSRTALTLGRLRNLSVDAAAGEIVCQWDDDDYSHPERLQLQADELIRADAGACFLTDHLQFIDEQGALYWVDWRLARAESGMDHLAPGTMMMRRDPRFRYPEDGPFGAAGRGLGAARQHLARHHGRAAARRRSPVSLSLPRSEYVLARASLSAEPLLHDGRASARKRGSHPRGGAALPDRPAVLRRRPRRRRLRHRLTRVGSRRPPWRRDRPISAMPTRQRKR